MTNKEIYNELRKEFDAQEIVKVVYHIYKFKLIDNAKWIEKEVEDTQWWKNKYQELLNNIKILHEQL